MYYQTLASRLLPISDRSQGCLNCRAESVRENYFPDLFGRNILAYFGGQDKRVHGKYWMGRRPHRIELTGYFRSPKIPDYVLEGTLIHEHEHISQDVRGQYRAPAQAEATLLGGLSKRKANQAYLEALDWKRRHWKQVTSEIDQENYPEGYRRKWDDLLGSPQTFSLEALTVHFGEMARSLGQWEPPKLSFFYPDFSSFELSHYWENSNILALHPLSARKDFPRAVLNFEMYHALLYDRLSETWKFPLEEEGAASDLEASVTRPLLWAKDSWPKYRSKWTSCVLLGTR